MSSNGSGADEGSSSRFVNCPPPTTTGTRGSEVASLRSVGPPSAAQSLPTRPVERVAVAADGSPYSAGSLERWRDFAVPSTSRVTSRLETQRVDGALLARSEGERVVAEDAHGVLVA